MPIYTGQITDPNFKPMNSFQIEVSARLERPAVSIGGARMYTTKPVTTGTSVDGSFEFQLVASEQLKGSPLYILTAHWLDSAGNYESRDLYKFFASATGGTIGGGIEHPLPNPAQVFFQPTEPNPWPSGWIWINSTTGDVNRKLN